MKKIFTLMCIAAATMTANAYDHVKLHFSEISENSATITIVDENGDEITTAAADILSVQKGNGDGDGVDCTMKTANLVPTYGILCPNYGNQVGNWWTITFIVEGLDGFKFNTASVDAYALVASGASQTGDTKTWKIDYQIGESEAELADWATCAPEEFVVGYYNAEEGRCHHTMTAVANTAAVAGNTLVLSVKMTKTAGGGCFAGIAELDLFNDLTVGIRGIDNQTVSQSYDLLGRSVNASTKGLYIQNGKTVIR